MPKSDPAREMRCNGCPHWQNVDGDMGVCDKHNDGPRSADETWCPDREMLRRWAACREERMAIIAFLNWCGEHRPPWLITTGATWPRAANAEHLLDAYHEIDQAQLERERRALLEAL